MVGFFHNQHHISTDCMVLQLRSIQVSGTKLQYTLLKDKCGTVIGQPLQYKGALCLLTTGMSDEEFTKNMELYLFDKSEPIKRKKKILTEQLNKKINKKIHISCNNHAQCEDHAPLM